MCVSLAFLCSSIRSFFSIETVIGIFFTYQNIYAKISKQIRVQNFFSNICFLTLKIKIQYEALFNYRNRRTRSIGRLR